ncbi:MAG: hypothetical protein J4428_02095 [Candidatus Aenigmarchaeota archaeon]|nr:hypothetical protein [Candidatus Aenigmarchaeota archaeon]
MFKGLKNLIATLLLLFSASGSNPSPEYYQNYAPKPPIYIEDRSTLLSLYPQLSELEDPEFETGVPHQRILVVKGAIADINGDGLQDMIVSTRTAYEQYYELLGWAEVGVGDSNVHVYLGSNSIWGETYPQKPSRSISLPEKYSVIEVVDLEGDRKYELVVKGQDESGQNITPHSAFVQIYKGDSDEPRDLLFAKTFYGVLFLIDLDYDGRTNIVIQNTDNRCDEILDNPICIQDVTFENFEILGPGAFMYKEVPRDVKFAYVFSVLKDIRYGPFDPRDVDRVLGIFRAKLGQDIVDEAINYVDRIYSQQSRVDQILQTPDRPLDESIGIIEQELDIHNSDVLSYAVQSAAYRNDVWVYDNDTYELMPLPVMFAKQAHPLATLIVERSVELSGYSSADVSPEVKEALAVVLTYTGETVYYNAGGEIDPKKGALVPGTNVYVDPFYFDAAVDYLVAKHEGRQSAVELGFQQAMEDFARGEFTTREQAIRQMNQQMDRDLSSAYRQWEIFYQKFGSR